MIRALIFDFDGLICDTEGPAYESWRETYESLGCTLPMDVWVTCIGGAPGTIDHCALLEQQLGYAIDKVALSRQRNAHKDELAVRLPALPGVLDYIAAAQQRGL